ncbi:hypothetical protein BH10BAC3_BH10BAC3_07030 [soil metagenome]
MKQRSWSLELLSLFVLVILALVFFSFIEFFTSACNQIDHFTYSIVENSH